MALITFPIAPQQGVNHQLKTGTVDIYNVNMLINTGILKCFRGSQKTLFCLNGDRFDYVKKTEDNLLF